MIKLARTLLFFVFSIGSFVTKGQDIGLVNPSLGEVPIIVEGSPNRGIVEGTFSMFNLSSKAFDKFAADPVIIEVELKGMQPAGTDPLTSIKGTFASKFNWVYDANTFTYTGSQSDTILGSSIPFFVSEGSIVIEMMTRFESESSDKSNGMVAKIIPPSYGHNDVGNDEFSILAYTKVGESTIVYSKLLDTAEVLDYCFDVSWANSTPLTVEDCNGNQTGKSFLGGDYTLDNDGCLVYNQPEGITESVKDTICVRICNDDNLCDDSKLVITIKPSVDIITPPIKPADSFLICLDTTWVTAGPISATDCDGRKTGVAYPINGTYVIQDDGCVKYTAPTIVNEGGNDTVCVTICDANNVCDSTFVIFPISVNEPEIIVTPLKPTEKKEVCLDTTWVLESPITATDCDDNTNGTAYPLGGTYVINDEGCVVYTAPSNITKGGLDTVCVKICDADNRCDSSIVVFPITPTPEVLVLDTITTRMVADYCLDTNWIVESPITVTDCDGNTTGNSSTGNGTYTISADGCFEYVPLATLDEDITDSFCVVICDALNLCDTTTVVVPVVVTEDAITTKPLERTEQINVCIDISWVPTTQVNVLDCDGNTSGTANPLGGTYIINDDGCVDYTAPSNIEKSGIDSVCVEICDANNVCDTVIITYPIIVTPPIVTPPTPLDVVDSIQICLDTDWVAASPITATDCNDSKVGVAQPLGGSYTINDNGCVDYKTPVGITESGVDTVCVKICDANGFCDSTLVLFPINVSPPVIITEPLKPTEEEKVCLDTNWVIASPITVTDCDSQTSGVAYPLGGTYFVGNDGCIDYTAPENPAKAGNDSVCVVICDAYDVCDTTIVVFPIELPTPVITPPTPIQPGDSIQLCLDTTWVVASPITATDCDDSKTGVAQPLGGSYRINDKGCVDYTAPIGITESGVDSVCVKICDTNGECVTSVILFPVKVSPPVIITEPLKPTEEEKVCLDTNWITGAPITVTDCNSQTSGIAQPLGGAYTIDDKGCVDYTAPSNIKKSGIDSVCVVICDANDICDTTIIKFPVFVDSTIIAPPSTPGDTVKTCVDTSWVLNSPATVTDCSGSTSGTAYPLGGTYLVDDKGCVEYIAPTNVKESGYDTVCVLVCDNLNICDSTIIVFPVIVPQEYVMPTMGQGESTSQCFDDEWTQSMGKISVCASDFNDNDDISYNINDKGCLEYSVSEDFRGNIEDTVCVEICNIDNFCVQHLVIFPIKQDTITVKYAPNEKNTIIMFPSSEGVGEHSNYEYCNGEEYIVIEEDLDPQDKILDVVITENKEDFNACFVRINGNDVDTTIVRFKINPDWADKTPIAENDLYEVTRDKSLQVRIVDNDEIYDAADVEVSLLNEPKGKYLMDGSGLLLYEVINSECAMIDSFEYELTTEYGSDTAWIKVEWVCQDFLVMTGFSPNGDDLNETFKIQGIENYDSNEVEVFNRNGNRVFKIVGYDNDNGWDGTWQNTDLPDGTYFYLIKLVKDGKAERVSGYVNIKR